MRPCTQFGGVILVDQAAFDEGAQDTGSPPSLHVGKRRRVQSMGKSGMKADARCIIRGDVWREYPLDDATVKTKFQCRLTSAQRTLSEAAGTKVDMLVQA